jgi:hypothetical protein
MTADKLDTKLRTVLFEVNLEAAFTAILLMNLYEKKANTDISIAIKRFGK